MDADYIARFASEKITSHEKDPEKIKDCEEVVKNYKSKLGSFQGHYSSFLADCKSLRDFESSIKDKTSGFDLNSIKEKIQSDVHSALNF